MRRIGLLSDTHGYIDQRILDHFQSCDEIWHAGDIGDLATARKLSAIKPLRAVWGNIDGQELRLEFSGKLRFFCEKVEVLMVHIGGYPGRYAAEIRKELISPPKLMICGHSHILKVVFDPRLSMLHINPGAAGIQGFHQVRTLVRFTIDQEQIKDLEVVELGPKRVGTV